MVLNLGNLILTRLAGDPVSRTGAMVCFWVDLICAILLPWFGIAWFMAVVYAMQPSDSATVVWLVSYFLGPALVFGVLSAKSGHAAQAAVR